MVLIISNRQLLADGRVNCDVVHPDHGLIPFTADPAETDAFSASVWAQLQEEGGIAPVAEITAAEIEEARLNSREVIKNLHASVLSNLTGGATPEERDTWGIKQQSASAYQNGTASVAEAGLIEVEAAGREISATVHADVVLSKATAYMGAVATAAVMHAQLDAALSLAETVAEFEAVIVSGQTSASQILAAFAAQNGGG
ncbi:hypothetical protein [Falsihalocynthiibacter arcticus]|uniref:hypothetical protein n=1 Tax=Falsihalocynthiibacter arcticus TaxID=1579316 RepID=UPI003002EAFC